MHTSSQPSHFYISSTKRRRLDQSAVSPCQNEHSPTTHFAAQSTSSSAKEYKANLIDEISRNSAVPLSDEQKEVLHHVEPPQFGNKITRVTAAAGTGKTTTILKLAEVAGKLGHTNILYLTFNKATAEEGKAKLSAVIPYNVFDGRTIDSLVMSMRNRDCGDGQSNGYKNIADPIEGEIERICEKEIQSFLRRNYSPPEKCKSRAAIDRMEEIAKKRVIWFLSKTLEHFCNSCMLLQQFGNKESSGRDYYPAVKFHREGGKGCELGFRILSDADWYADTVAHILWPTLEKDCIKRFHIEMKRAHLNMLEVRATCILVDEAQDCNACQIDWLAKQANIYGKQVFFVGDPAQSIYSFRGAKSRYLMELENASSCKLTKSWRFGSDIGRIANLCLFAKENSPQTNTGSSRKRTWEPYRIIGSAREAGVVTSQPLIDLPLATKQVTIIARKNATLFMEAINLLSPTLLQDTTDESSDDDASSTKKCPVKPFPLISDIKIHLVGQDGGIKALRQFNGMMSKIEELQELYLGETNRLSKRQFPEFHGLEVDWKSFCQHVQDLELGRYEFPVGVVRKFREKSNSAVACFRECIIEKNYSAEDADVVLTSCHKAKGLEWDNVQVCDDFPLSALPVKNHADGPFVSDANSSNGTRQSWQFKISEYGDELNLVYVACTRAKKALSIPFGLKTFIRDCDGLYSDLKRIDAEKNTAEVFGEGKTAGKLPTMAPEKAKIEQKFFVFSIEDLNMNSARNVCADIVEPIRNENLLKEDDKMLDIFVGGDLYKGGIAEEERVKTEEEISPEELNQQEQESCAVYFCGEEKRGSWGEDCKSSNEEYV